MPGLALRPGHELHETQGRKKSFKRSRPYDPAEPTS